MIAYIVIIGIGLLLGLVIFTVLNIKYILSLKDSIKNVNQQIESNKVTHVNVDTTDLKHQLSSEIQSIPNKVLESITGSNNNSKGKLGEMIGYLTLKAEYDRIIPLGNIVDFICIKFATENTPGSVDFIDIKTGKNARLNSDQKKLREILNSKNINFKTISINEIESLCLSED
jgi:predicted Holliday junction resolvase-like endonuclease